MPDPKQRLDPVQHAAMVAEQARLRVEAELEQQASADIRAVFRTQEGRRALWWLLSRRCEIWGDVYVPGGHEAERHTSYNAGRRFVGLEICRLAGITIDQLRELDHVEGASEGRNEARERLRGRHGFEEQEEADGQG